jgi:Ubiquitin carboxyl-terminal hydrolase
MVLLALFPCCCRSHRAGRYDLTAVLTHKGRSADSGHYVAWVKQPDGKWIQFDDDRASQLANCVTLLTTALMEERPTALPKAPFPWHSRPLLRHARTLMCHPDVVSPDRCADDRAQGGGGAVAVGGRRLAHGLPAAVPGPHRGGVRRKTVTAAGVGLGSGGAAAVLEPVGECCPATGSDAPQCASNSAAESLVH